MNGNILQVNIEKRGLVFDPRTKLLLLITMTTFVLGGAGGEQLSLLIPCLCFVPILLMMTSKKFKTALLCLFVYGAAVLIFQTLRDKTTGLLKFLLLGSFGIITRFLPSVMMGMYAVSTTTASEFTAAMLRMHVSEKLIIPLSVMFRLFPTVVDEFSSINAAMRMRGVSFGGRNMSKILEYRLIPLMSCSVKIGDELSAAALIRGLGGNVKRTNVFRIGFHIQDIIAMSLCIFCSVNLFLTAYGLV